MTMRKAGVSRAKPHYVRRPFSPALGPGLTLIFLAAMLSTCGRSKHEASEISQTPQTPAKLSSSPSLYNDILEFNSPDALEKTLDRVMIDNETYVQHFLENRLGIRALPDSIGADSLEMYDLLLNGELNVYKIYENFGKARGILPLIGQFIPMQKAWMREGGSGKDPFTYYPYPLAFQSVLNIYHEVKIGSSVFKFDAVSGTAYEITDGDYNTVLALRKDISTGNAMPNVIVFARNANACRTYVNNNVSKDYYKSGKRFRLKSYCAVTPMHASAITQNFRVANTGALLWSLCQMSNTIHAPELYNNSLCDAPQRSDSSSNGVIKSRFRLEAFTHLGEGWLNIHSPSQKTFASSQIYSPNDGLYPFAW